MATQAPPDQSAAIENLVNQIAHDVRNFAFTVGLQAEMGLRRGAQGTETKAQFESILRQLDGLKAYLEKLLLFGRPARLALATVNVGGLVRDVVQRCRHARTADGRTAEVEVAVDASLSSAIWDARLLGAALEAVVDNALRSADPPPPVAVRAFPRGEGITIETEDRGPGIPPETLAKIETPMSARRAGGAGLGLAIARKLVEAHGGRFELASGAEGTTVRFHLPKEVVSA